MTDPTVIRATLGSNEGIRRLVRYRREEAVIGDVSRLKSRVSGLVSVTETVVDVAPLYQICRRRGVPSDGEKERWWGIEKPTDKGRRSWTSAHPLGDRRECPRNLLFHRLSPLF